MLFYFPLPTSHLPLASALLTPAFLYAGAALVAIPILIHILNRRRYKVVPWAAMEYLLAAMKKNRRRLKFEQWLLLATRCLVMLLLGLALARPMGCDRSGLAGLVGRRTGLSVIVIDNSYSMAYPVQRVEAATHLDQAKNLARQLIDRLSSGGESVALITAARPASAIVAHPMFNLDDARAAVDRVQQTYSDTDLAGALQEALRVAHESSEPNKRLYILTDGTRSAWETGAAASSGTDRDAAPGREASGALSALGPQLAKAYRITHFNLGMKNQWNQAVLSVKPAANLVTTRFGADFTSLLAGYGEGADPRLQWRLDDQLLPGGGAVKLDAQKTMTQPNAHFTVGGAHVISATLVSENPLKLDDTRRQVVNVASDVKVLLVEGDRGMGLMSGSAAFLQLALAPPSQDVGRIPGRTTATDSYITPEVISDLQLSNKVLSDYRAIILTNVAQVPQSEAEQLKAFVQQGGALLWFMGEQVNAEAYNRTLLPLGLIPGALAKRVSVGAGEDGFLFDFRPNGRLHPYLDIFRGQEKSGLDTAQVFTYWQVDPSAALSVSRILNYLPRGTSSSANAAAASDSGASPRLDPAITVQPLGDGHIVFVTTTANADWTSFPAKPAYVTLMHELVSHSVTAGDDWMNLAVGERLRIPARVKLTGVPTLTDAQLKELPLDSVTAADGQAHYQSDPIDRPGLYLLKAGERSIPIAVNVPSDEADVRTLDDNALRRALGNIDLTMLGDHLPPLAAQQSAGEDYGWTVMVALFSLVALESFMAMRFGHQRRKAAA